MVETIAEQEECPMYSKKQLEMALARYETIAPLLEKNLEPELERLLARKDVKITFVDFRDTGKAPFMPNISLPPSPRIKAIKIH